MEKHYCYYRKFTYDKINNLEEQNELNIEFLNALIKDREENADTLEKPSMQGVKNSVIDKYTDQAHFIYELLQNADDTKATYARFKLYHDKLVFAHNGKRHFGCLNVILYKSISFWVCNFLII